MVMVPDRVACVSDLKPGDWVALNCACGHATYLPPYALVEGLWMKPQDRLTDLAFRLSCGSCRRPGVAVVSVLWAAAAWEFRRSTLNL